MSIVALMRTDNLEPHLSSMMDEAHRVRMRTFLLFCGFNDEHCGADAHRRPGAAPSSTMDEAHRVIKPRVQLHFFQSRFHFSAVVILSLNCGRFGGCAGPATGCIQC